jgi:hypothetical protein
MTVVGSALPLTFFTLGASVLEAMIPIHDSDRPHENAPAIGEPLGDHEGAERQLVATVWMSPDGRLQFDSHLVPGEDPALDVITDGMREVTFALERNVKALGNAGRLRTLSRRRNPVAKSLGFFVGAAVSSAADSEISMKELNARLQVTSDTVDVVFQGDSRELDSLIDHLTPVSPTTIVADNEHTARRAEARSRIRLEALYRKLIRDSFTVKELGAFRLSRQRLQQLRKDDRLFAVEVPNQKGLLHPRWQFDETNRPRVEMPDLIAAARDGGLDAIGLHQIMVNPEATEDGALVDLLDLGRVEDVLEILRAGGG